MYIDTTFWLSWLFFKLVDISNILILFSYFTSCVIWWCKVALVINFTNCVVTRWHQYISLTVFFDFFWTVVYYCVVSWINWFFIHISYRSFKLISFCIFIVYINTSIHFFIDISDGWSWFINLTWNWIRWFKVTIFINLTYRIITFWYNLICLTIFCLDEIRFFTFLSSVIWCIIWWIWCILTRFLNLFTVFVYISNNNFTYFKFVDVSYILILFSNCTRCWVWWCKMSLVINFTYSVVTSWDQLVSLTFEFNLVWTIVYNCIVGLINWLSFFIGYIWLNSLTFCILIMHVNITCSICFTVIVRYIGRNFFNGWKRIVIKEWWISRRFISWCVPTNDIGSIVSNGIDICWKLWWICKGIPSGLVEPTTQAHIPISTIRISCYFKMVFSILTVNISDLFRFSCCSSRCWFSSWLNRIWGIQ